MLLFRNLNIQNEIDLNIQNEIEFDTVDFLNMPDINMLQKKLHCCVNLDSIKIDRFPAHTGFIEI